MFSLRQEYKRKQTIQEKVVTEAALAWLSKNVVIINEKIDRTTVSRLIDSIQKFEDTFGNFTDRLPIISRYISSAEEGLQQVITGKANDKKASAMLKKLTILYFTFSDFFTRDLPILLRAKIFEAPKANPDMRLDMIRNRGEVAYEPYMVRDALANALKPTREEKKLLSKIYRSSLLPKLNSEEIANQLMTLTYNELEELTKVGKVPMVATQEEMGSTFPESIQYKKDGKILTEEAFLNEVRLLTEGKLDDLQNSVSNVKKIVSSIPALNQNLGNKVDEMQSELLRVMNSEEFDSWKQAVTKGYKQASQSDQVPGEGGFKKAAKGIGGAIKGAITSGLNPQQKAIGEFLGKVNATIETFKAVANAWPAIQRVIAEKETLNPKDINNIRQMLNKTTTQVKPGWFSKTFGGRQDPYIGGEEIVDALLSTLEEE